jgi:hypothetical protein
LAAAWVKAKGKVKERATATALAWPPVLDPGRMNGKQKAVTRRQKAECRRQLAERR